MAGPSPADITIAAGEANPPPGGTELRGHVGTPDEVNLTYSGIGSFATRSNRVTIAADPTADEDQVRNIIVGPVLAILMHLRGFLVMHASCVAFGDLAVAFLGDSQMGKSTIATACYLAGARYVADDATAFDVADTTVVPAYPRAKLWPESAQAVGLDPADWPEVFRGMGKRSVRVAERFDEKPIELARVYVLASGPVPRLTRIEPADAFVEVVRHSYAKDLLDMTHARVSHFRQVTSLCERVSVRRLTTGEPLARVQDLPNLVQADLAKD